MWVALRGYLRGRDVVGYALSRVAPEKWIPDHLAESNIRDHRPWGERNGHARLTGAQIAEIRMRYTGRWGEETALAKEYGVAVGHIANILSGRHRRYDEGAVRLARPRVKLSESQVLTIRRRAMERKRGWAAVCACEFGVSKRYVYMVANGLYR